MITKLKIYLFDKNVISVDRVLKFSIYPTILLLFLTILTNDYI